LAQPVAIETGAVVASDVRFTIEGGFAAPTRVTMPLATPVAMSIERPRVELHTSAGRATLDAVELPLRDVTISAEALPPKGLVLRNLVVRAPSTRAEIIHEQPDALELRATVPLSLDWSVALEDGSLYRLGTVHTNPVELDVTIVRASDGSATATVQATCAGTCWSIDGVAKLSDGAVYLEADAEVTAAE
jgi:hypothetical protein